MGHTEIGLNDLKALAQPKQFCAPRQGYPAGLFSNSLASQIASEQQTLP